MSQARNSHSYERVDLIDRFHEIFADAQVDYLTGEREFIGYGNKYFIFPYFSPFRLMRFPGL